MAKKITHYDNKIPVGFVWKECAICGYDRPKKEMKKNANGSLVCKTCLDEENKK